MSWKSSANDQTSNFRPPFDRSLSLMEGGCLVPFEQRYEIQYEYWETRKSCSSQKYCIHIIRNCGTYVKFSPQVRITVRRVGHVTANKL